MTFGPLLCGVLSCVVVRVRTAKLQISGKCVCQNTCSPKSPFLTPLSYGPFCGVFGILSKMGATLSQKRALSKTPPGPGGVAPYGCGVWARPRVSWCGAQAEQAARKPRPRPVGDPAPAPRWSAISRHDDITICVTRCQGGGGGCSRWGGRGGRVGLMDQDSPVLMHPLSLFLRPALDPAGVFWQHRHPLPTSLGTAGTVLLWTTLH